MRASLLLFILLCGLVVGLQAQTADSFRVTASWPVAAGATELGMDAERNFIVAVTGKHRIYKYLATAGYDSVVSIGGQGSGGEGFNQPTCIRAASRSELYVLDYGNRRLVLFSTNLRLVRSTDYDELPVQAGNEPGERYLYPKAFEVGPLGEVYLLNQDDNRVYKFDATGRFELAFGGLDYGAGRILAGDDLRANAANYLAVPDSARQQALIFDNFGNYRYTLAPKLPFRWHGLTSWGDRWVLFGAQQFAVMDEGRAEPWVFAVDAVEGLQRIQDIEAKGNRLYVLAQDRVTLLDF
jgi:hypothetical protein